MNQMEKAALDHLREYHRYAKSIKAKNDLLISRQRHMMQTIASGHSPKCGILKCHPECKRV